MIIEFDQAHEIEADDAPHKEAFVEPVWEGDSRKKLRN
jgi:hypothetical protein